MDKLQAIRFFLKLSETLSFKGTAEHFGVPPSTVSRSIKKLEDELGATLIERTTRQVRLTEAGDWYQREVAGPIRALKAADELVDAQAREPVGTLRLTALQGYGEVCLYPALERFRATYPQILCDIELSDRALDLSTGEIDIALRATARPPDELVAKRLHTHDFLLVASPEYFSREGRPENLKELEQHASLGYRGPTGLYPWYARRSDGELVEVTRNLKFITNQGLFLLEACMKGEGIAFLPRWGVRDELAKGLLEEVSLDDAEVNKTPGAEQHIFMLFHPSKARLGKVRAMVDFLMAELGEPELRVT